MSVPNNPSTKGETEVQITRSEKTYKPKDPRRVEAGKRLGAISKAGKEKKAKERFEAKHSASVSGESSGSVFDDWTFPVGCITIVGLGGLYYAYSKSKQTKTDTFDGEATQPKASAIITPRSKPQLDSFDE